ncbi:MAG TPA: hypothetical protein VJ962_04105 [Clostridia bacterium]|nr:hypothetical protein [Clostridia bacterium]
MYYKSMTKSEEVKFSNKDIFAMIIAAFQIITPFFIIIFAGLGIALGLFQLIM